MNRILHILTKDNDELAAGIIARQQEQVSNALEVVDLTSPEPDYSALLDKIFAADSVEVW